VVGLGPNACVGVALGSWFSHGTAIGRQLWAAGLRRCASRRSSSPSSRVDATLAWIEQTFDAATDEHLRLTIDPGAPELFTWQRVQVA